MRRVAWMRIIKYLFTKKLLKLYYVISKVPTVLFSLFSCLQSQPPLITEPTVYHCIDFFFGVIDLRRFRAYCGVFLLLLMWLLKLG